ncbi:NAD-dependent epimerase/dehydratase family protein [Novosphingobium sp. BL-52-GroH]|uniref:NAD-dependent epimerase/dehydratase family protein n=1 Tax=Novosphingobium sp. BL-52-GroH TaxID=3349877 RepID=UPI00384A5981
MMSGKKILVTGGAGMMGRPVAEMLAPDNEVWVSSLFDESEQPVREALDAQGIHTVAWDMSRDGVDVLPGDFTHVLHTAMLRDTTSYDDSVETNGISVARLMTHCRNAESFVFVSTMGVYKRNARDYPYVETDALGGDHSSMGPYVVGKIASEGVARALARLYNLPTTIVRPNVIYGPYGWGGVPILFLKRMMEGQPIEAPLDGENHCSLIHTDDIARFMPGFWAAASVPATVVNLGGDEVVTMPEYMGYVSEITGLPVDFVRSPTTRDTYVSDPAKRKALVGATQVEWRDGIRRTVAAHMPHLLKEKVG